MSRSCSYNQFHILRSRKTKKRFLSLDQDQLAILQDFNNFYSRPEGEGVAACLEKSKKKSKEPPAGGVPKEKRKLLSIAISAAKKARVNLARCLAYLENNFDLKT